MVFALFIFVFMALLIPGACSIMLTFVIVSMFSPYFLDKIYIPSSSSYLEKMKLEERQKKLDDEQNTRITVLFFSCCLICFGFWWNYLFFQK